MSRLWVIVALLVFLMSGCGHIASMVSANPPIKTSNPETFIQSFWDDVAKGDYRRVAAYYTPEQQQVAARDDPDGMLDPWLRYYAEARVLETKKVANDIWMVHLDYKLRFGHPNLLGSPEYRYCILRTVNGSLRMYGVLSDYP